MLPASWLSESHALISPSFHTKMAPPAQSTPMKDDKDDGRVECIGTLLVHTSDLQELSNHTGGSRQNDSSSCSPPIDSTQTTDSNPSTMSNLRKRLTKDFQDPPRYDQEEADFWMDD